MKKKFQFATWRQVLRRLGFTIELTAEEQGLEALREFARKGFDAPFLPRTGNTHLHPPIPPEDPTHPQHVPAADK